MKHRVKMWGIVSKPGELLQNIGLSDNPNLYHSKEKAEEQAKRNGSRLVEVILDFTS